MMEFMQTLGKGIMQGINQFIDNDLHNFIPLFIFAAVLIAGSYLWYLIKKYIIK